MNYGGEGDGKAHQEKVEQIPTPEKDPVCGKEGPLLEHRKV